MAVRYLRMPDVRIRYGNVSASTIYDWVKRGILPAPYLIGMRASAWREDELDARDTARRPAVVVAVHAQRA